MAHWRTINCILCRNKDNYISLDPPIPNIYDAYHDHFIRSNNLEVNYSHTEYSKYLTTPLMFSMYTIPTNCSDAKYSLQTMKSDSPGLDEIPPIILKHSCESLAVSLTHITNLSFKRSIFPEHLKMANVIPIFKSVDRCHIRINRPLQFHQNSTKYMKNIYQYV